MLAGCCTGICFELKQQKGEGDIKSRGPEAMREDMVSPVVSVEWKGKYEFVQLPSYPQQ